MRTPSARARRPPIPRTVCAVSALALALADAGCSAGLDVSCTGWRGDFATGDLSQWHRVQAVRRSSVELVRYAGRMAARFRIAPGDNPLPDSPGERAELEASLDATGAREGAVQWYAWSTLFPTDFDPSPGTGWNIFLQFHDSENDGCPPNLVLQVTTRTSPPRIKLRARGGDLHGCEPEADATFPLAPLELGRWYDFVLEVRWSSGRDGFVRLWLDGRRVVDTAHSPTLYDGQRAYLKQGFYREPSLLTSELYQEGVRRACARDGLR